MLIIKFVSYITIFITSALIGFSLGGKYSRRFKNIVDLQHSIRLLQTEVIVMANPLPFALENISRKISVQMKEVYTIILNSIQDNQSGDLYLSFLQSLSYLKNECLLKEEDIDVFLTLGKVIGKTDRIDQAKQFEYALNELDFLIDDAKDEKNKYEKMYRSLGVLMGLGMIIILI